MKQDNFNYKNYELALQRQKERYFKRAEKMLKTDKEKCYFLTFTFSDETLKRTNEKTRLRYIKSYLNEQAKDYILNIDYGTDKEREHYHAFILAKYKIVIASTYKLGYLKIKQAYKSKRFKNTTTKTTAEKLTEHAFKSTTNGAKIIYSRKLKVNTAFNYKDIADSILKNYVKNKEDQKTKILNQIEQKDRQSLNQTYLEILQGKNFKYKN